MTNKEINDFKSRIDSLLDRRRLGDAFSQLRDAAKAISSWSISDRIAKAEQGYSYMLRYLIDGADDPSRTQVHAELIREAATLRDLLIREMSIVDTPTLYYNTLRSVGSHRDETLEKLYATHRHAIDRSSPFRNMTTGTASSSETDKLMTEMNERDIFNRLWVTFPLNVDETSVTRDFIADDSLPFRTRALAVSALTLSLLTFFDERKLRLLIDAYLSDEPHISVRALTGIALVLDKYQDIELSPETINSFNVAKERPGWQTDIRQVFVELIRTNDTRRISAKLNDEILPDIKRMGQNLADRFKDASADSDHFTADANPEWDEILGDEKIRNNLKELGDLQEEGADVHMSTFSSLKQFPFFNEVANWFMPYDPAHSAVAAYITEDSPLASMIAAGEFVCDSDKYSMALSMSMMPESQRTQIMSQLDSQTDAISEMLSSVDPGNRPVDRRREINNYVHSLYRFYHLFRRKGDFYNPFAHVINPVDIPLLADSFSHEDSLLTLGEFYFKIGLYDYARRILVRIDEISAPEASRYQKLGYCCEKLGDFETAASYYEQADLLDGSNIWNLRHLISVYRRLGQYSSAISASDRLMKLMPDDINVAVNSGRLMILAEQYDLAIERLRHAEYNDPDNLKLLRPLAWALFLTRNFDDARRYYDRIISIDPTAVDLLNYGHLAWAQHRLGEAVNYYKLSAERSSVEMLIENIRSDSRYLAHAGVDSSEMPLLIDAIIYSLKQ